jgi:hypothetical protein
MGRALSIDPLKRTRDIHNTVPCMCDVALHGPSRRSFGGGLGPTRATLGSRRIGWVLSSTLKTYTVALLEVRYGLL